LRAVKKLHAVKIARGKKIAHGENFLPLWFYVYEMAQSFNFYAPLGVAPSKQTNKRKQDSRDDLSDPPCSVRAQKRIRKIHYHI
jgi:hypothetical protein